MYQDYYIQEYKSFLQDLLLFGQLKVDEVPQDLRLCGGRSFYVTARRAARERRDANAYVLACRLQLQDMEAVEELSFHDEAEILRNVFVSLWFDSDYFKGEKVFRDFLEEQKAAYPDAYRTFTA
uniref:hypothetical protein n=1 Tax=Lactococcus garvieae TaxID=1363 RepID=UPI00359C5F2C